MQTILRYDAIPGMFPIFMKILFSRKKGFRPGDTFPDIRAVISGVTVDREKLRAYREICELEDDGNLPLLYPHVFTAPMHMAILSHKDFPIPLLGMLHFRNHSIQHRPVKEDEKLDVEVSLSEHRIVKQGFEFDYIIKVESAGELVWESITTYLKQGKFGKDFVVPQRPSAAGGGSGVELRLLVVDAANGRVLAHRVVVDPAMSVDEIRTAMTALVREACRGLIR